MKDCVGVELNTDGSVLWRGLRVRVGCFSGAPDVERDEVTKRMDFYGPAVNRAARVEGQADGGQFLICETTYLHTLAENGSAQDGGELTSHLDADPSLREALTVVDCGVRELKGIALPEHLYQVLPNRLAARDFGSAAATTKSVASKAHTSDPAPTPAVPAASSAADAAATPTPSSEPIAAAPKPDALLAPPRLMSQSSSMSDCPPDPPMSTPPPHDNGATASTTSPPSPAASQSTSGGRAIASTSSNAPAAVVTPASSRRKLTTQTSQLRQPTPLMHGKEGGAGGKLGLLENKSREKGDKIENGVSSSRSGGVEKPAGAAVTTSQSHLEQSSTPSTIRQDSSYDVCLCYCPPDAHVLSSLLHEVANSSRPCSYFSSLVLFLATYYE